MNIKSFWWAVIGAVVLVGCAASTPRVMAPKQCPPQVCEATITMDLSSGTPKPVIDYDVLKMSKADTNPVIIWVLDVPPSSDYEFRRDSIAPHTAAPSGNKQTTSRQDWDDQIRYLTNSDRRYLVQNKNGRSAPLYYDVRVYNKRSGDSYPLDPAIMNDP